LCESRTYANGQVSLPNICCRVHRAEDAEVGVRHDLLNLSRLGKQDAWTLIGASQQIGNTCQRIGRGQVDLVQEHPVAVAHSLDKVSLNKGERKCPGAPGNLHVELLEAASKRVPPR